MPHEDRWAQCWPNVIPSIRHVETLAQKNAWRAEALDRRFRIEAALKHHRTNHDGICPTCQKPSPCATYQLLTTHTPWRRAVQGQPVRLPLDQTALKAALAEMLPEPTPADEPKPIGPSP